MAGSNEVWWFVGTLVSVSILSAIYLWVQVLKLSKQEQSDDEIAKQVVDTIQSYMTEENVEMAQKATRKRMKRAKKKVLQQELKRQEMQVQKLEAHKKKMKEAEQKAKTQVNEQKLKRQATHSMAETMSSCASDKRMRRRGSRLNLFDEEPSISLISEVDEEEFNSNPFYLLLSDVNIDSKLARFFINAGISVRDVPFMTEKDLEDIIEDESGVKRLKNLIEDKFAPRSSDDSMNIF